MLRMAKQYPEEISGYFFLNAVLLWLMINYNMPLASIYSWMVIIDAIMYLVPVQFGFFKWIPFAKKGESKIPKYVIGVAAGIGFLYLYNAISSTPMAAVFATTAFGKSEILTILVYSILISFVETRFFFRTLMQFVAWKSAENFRKSPFSLSGLKLMGFFGLIFTLFHATAKGITNNAELAATFVFGALSVGMILYFQEWIQAFILHLVVNSKSMGLVDIIPQLAQYWYAWVIAIAVGYFVYRSSKHRGRYTLT